MNRVRGFPHICPGLLTSNVRVGGHGFVITEWVAAWEGRQFSLMSSSVYLQAGSLVLMKIKGILPCVLEGFSRYTL